MVSNTVVSLGCPMVDSDSIVSVLMGLLVVCVITSGVVLTELPAVEISTDVKSIPGGSVVSSGIPAPRVEACEVRNSVVWPDDVNSSAVVLEIPTVVSSSLGLIASGVVLLSSVVWSPSAVGLCVEPCFLTAEPSVVDSDVVESLS